MQKVYPTLVDCNGSGGEVNCVLLYLRIELVALLLYLKVVWNCFAVS